MQGIWGAVQIHHATPMGRSGLFAVEVWCLRWSCHAKTRYLLLKDHSPYSSYNDDLSNANLLGVNVHIQSILRASLSILP